MAESSPKTNSLSQIELVRQIHERVLAIDEKLDSKVNKEECVLQLHAGREDAGKLEERLEKMETRTRNMEIRQGGISAVIATAAVWIKATFFG